MTLLTATKGFVIRMAKDEDINYIEKRMRAADRLEINRSHMLGPRRALEIGLTDSTCFTAELNGLPVMMFGIVHETDTTAVIWALGTDDIQKIPFAFVKAAKMMIQKFHKVYEVLYNYVDVENTLSVKWLEKCGASFEQPIAYGPTSHLFKKFTLKRSGHV